MKSLLAAVALALSFGLAGLSAARAQVVPPPPPSDSWEVPTQFLACRGNPYALCYYSGPDIATPSRRHSDPPVMPCVPDPANPDAADCTCYAVTELPGAPDGNPLGLELQFNYVLMTSILQPQVLEETAAECGKNGEGCLNLVNLASCAASGFTDDGCAQANVCSMLGDIKTGQKQTLYKDLPDVDLISTFSFEHAAQHSFGSTSCEAAPYAGCMTAPCSVAEDGMTSCQCPVYTGPFQVGQQEKRLKELGLGCDISPNVWSAANHIK